MVQKKWFWLLVVVFLLTISGCENGSLGESEGAKTVTDTYTANTVAHMIYRQAKDPISPSNTTVWNSETINGSYGGSVVVDGEYEELNGGWTSDSTEEYKNVSMVFSRYHSEGKFASITGTAVMDGKLTIDSSSSGNRYNGGWSLIGTVSLTPESGTTSTYNYKVKDADFQIYILNYYYNGNITIDGVTYDVDSNY